ncbi:MAG: GntR family transcriptional regulator [Clostridia bacterium]|nr:GntR family transcriptional regulator [Clostridia bacterium]
MIVLSSKDSRPLHEQITEKMKNLIIGGYLKEDDKVPSVRELASQLAINPNTIQKAYKNLELEGYIFSKPAKGYFVKMPDGANSKIPELTTTLGEIVRELYFLGFEKERLDKIINHYYKGGESDD